MNRKERKERREKPMKDPPRNTRSTRKENSLTADERRFLSAVEFSRFLVRGREELKFRMSKLPDAAGILTFLISNLPF
jgi:hypothetical protein